MSMPSWSAIASTGPAGEHPPGRRPDRLSCAILRSGGGTVKEDARKAEWTQSRRKSWSGFTGLTNRMIDSDAFQALKSVHSVKVLVWFWSMAQYRKEKKKPGQDSPIGNLTKILNCKDLSFEYRIARYRGMLPKQFVHALRELHRHGFIDIEHHGRGIKGDWTRFAYSDRWKDYGTTGWKELPFPVADRVGWRSTKKNYYRKGKLTTSQKGSYRVVEMTDDFPNGKLKTPNLTDLSTSQSGSPSRSTKGCTALDGDGRDEKRFEGKEVGNSARARRDDAQPSIPSNGNGLSELLSHLPDDKKEYIISLVRTVDAGELPPRLARTKIIMPRLLPAADAHLLFPDPLKFGMWGPLEDRIAARNWT
jgi:hypothetical protein